MDVLHESQNKNEEDEKYLTIEGGWIQLPTFSTRRQQLRNEGKSQKKSFFCYL